MNPRVLHVIASSGLYGAERMLLALLPALRRLGCDASLLALNEPGSPGAALGEALERLQVPVRYARFPGRPSIRGLLRLGRALRDAAPDIVHVHGYKAMLLAAPLAMLRRTPAVTTMHTEVLKTAADVDLYVRLETPILRRLRAVAAVSAPIREELIGRGVSPDRITIVPNGIADPREAAASRPESDRPVLVFTGRLIEGKDVPLLLDALHRLRREFARVELVVAGDGPERERLEALAASLGITDAVRFAGFVSDVQPLLAHSTCFVLPSRAEGMPIALLEAMSLGLPIVSTNVGSIPSIVRHGVEALLFDPGDADALTEHLRAVLSDAAVRERLGARARERFAREFTAERMAARYLELYASSTGRAG